MKVTYNWLKDFVEIKISAEKLADKLTMAGLEVTSLEKKGADFVFEIEITSNRPDLLSVIGIAREVAAITKSRLKSLCAMRYALCAKNAQRTTHNAQPITIKIENNKDCPLYIARVIRGVKVSASPAWLKQRLELIGCRSINNIVDITNYVLFEYGEPLHAFDLDKLNLLQGILVRRAKNGEEIVTIDGVKKILSEDMLLITSGRPVAIAGIMGSKESEVTESTNNILLEAAIFNPVLIRRARQKLGLQTDSAFRFERGVDLETVKFASLRATQLFQEVSQGSCVLAKSIGADKQKTKTIQVNADFICKSLGANIAKNKIKNILSSLNFQVKLDSKDNLRVKVPAYRQDISSPIDLVEETGRIFGFASIPTTLPAVRPQITLYNRRGLVSFTKNILLGLGLNEVITYSLIAKYLLENFSVEQGASAIEIANPLSKEQEILRSALLPGLAACVAYNLNQKQDYINIFEIANVFSQAAEKPKEELVLGIALCGVKSYVLKQGVVKEEVGFLHLKGILEAWFERLGISDYNFSLADNQQTISIYVQKEKIGQMSKLTKNALDELNIKNKEVFALELSLERAFAYTQLENKFTSLPKYPGITRDISFILKDTVSIKEILEAVKERGRPLLTEVRIADYYQGRQIPAGFRGLTISCLYRSEQRTLTEAEINPVQMLVYAILTERFGAKIR